MIRHEEIAMETLPDPCPDTSYLEQEGFEERLRQLPRTATSDSWESAQAAPSTSGSARPATSSFTASRAPAFGVSKQIPHPSTSRCSSKDEQSVLLAMLDAIGCRRSGRRLVAPPETAPFQPGPCASHATPEGLYLCARVSALVRMLIPEQTDPEPDTFARPTIALDRQSRSARLTCSQVLPPPVEGSPLSARYG